MSSRILVFSADELRGKILEKVLNRNGFECLIFNRILETRDEIVPYSPEVVIVDTERCISEEINHLKNVCQTLKHGIAIVIGRGSVINSFKGSLFRKVLCLADPFDPELIAVRIEKTISQKKNTGLRTGSDMLEKTLKHLLHLD